MILAEMTFHAPGQLNHDHDFDQEQQSAKPPHTILFAEDNDDLRYVMECSLKMMGFEVIACADGRMALAMFRAYPVVDILLTDYDMPYLTGLELARKVTACKPSLPVMFVTGSTLSAESRREIEERSWTFVSKPCRMPVLERTLRQILETPRSGVA